ncbi:hypothetical protein CDAR_215981 [Caerostris darwini]|uniref:LAGLIDADG homing endonuclease n=1 Tax=Caerostris darwini TaxID=1538125 RepID=A0AAV4NIE3_9ARAC|nr:hypothetical protein CDAR_215981 [Caerostris darwini]
MWFHYSSSSITLNVTPLTLILGNAKRGSIKADSRPAEIGIKIGKTEDGKLLDKWLCHVILRYENLSLVVDEEGLLFFGSR